MKISMEKIQEMLHHSNESQSKIDKERMKQESLVSSCENIQIQLQETRYKIKEIQAMHNDIVSDAEHK